MEDDDDSDHADDSSDGQSEVEAVGAEGEEEVLVIEREVAQLEAAEGGAAGDAEADAPVPDEDDDEAANVAHPGLLVFAHLEVRSILYHSPFPP